MQAGLYYALIFGSDPAIMVSMLPTYNSVGMMASIGLILFYSLDFLDTKQYQ